MATVSFATRSSSGRCSGVADAAVTATEETLKPGTGDHWLYRVERRRTVEHQIEGERLGRRDCTSVHLDVESIGD